MTDTPFSEEKMRQKLAKLQNTPESITTNGLWMIHHGKFHAEEITETWLKLLKSETNPPRLVNLIYLANEVIQNSRKRCPDLMTKFFPVFESALRHCAKIPGPEVMKVANRVIGILGERGHYSPDMITRLELAAAGKKPVAPTTDLFAPDKPATKEVPYDSEAISASAADVVELLRKLASAPSEDTKLRVQLNDCPEVISNQHLLDTIRSSVEVKSLLEQISEVEPLTEDYCRRLTGEMEDRRKLQQHIEELMLNVRAAVDHQEKLLKEVKRKEERMKSDLAEIKRAYESLPDLSSMESTAPLPSAESLFS